MQKNRSPYDLNGVPELGKAIPLGLQHIMAMFMGNITPIIIVANVLGFAQDMKINLIQATILVAGLNTLVQVYTLGPMGAKLPVVVGTNFSFAPVAISIAGKFGYEGVLGAALIGGIFEAFLGFHMKKIRKFFPPIVTGTVILAIGLYLLPVGINSFAGGFGAPDFASTENLILGTLVLAVVIFFKEFTKGITSSGAIFIGTIVGTIIAFFMGKIDVTPLLNADYISVPKPFSFGYSFHLEAIIPMILMFIVSAIETMGDMSGITVGGAGRQLEDKELKGGIISDGVGSAFATMFSVLPTTSFSQNTGIIAMTGVMSRFVVGIGAMFLVASAFIPKVAAAFTLVPQSVIGGSLVMIFSMIAISGINLINQEPLEGRNAVILAVSLGLGYGVGLVPAVIEAFPENIRYVFTDSGFVVAGTIAVLLNLILPKKDDVEIDLKNISKELSKEIA
ncbi:MAG: nucleobase:cation symporter-2 family protein [Cetobacterium sp.]